MQLIWCKLILVLVLAPLVVLWPSHVTYPLSVLVYKNQ